MIIVNFLNLTKTYFKKVYFYKFMPTNYKEVRIWRSYNNNFLLIDLISKRNNNPHNFE